jgi:HK97 family phage portal protein
MRLSTIQNKAYKALVSIPAWQQNLLNDSADFTNSITSVQEAYSRVPLIYRAVKMRCDALSSVPIKVFSGDTAVEWPYRADIRDLVWKTEAALLGQGRAFILKLKNNVRVLDLQYLNPFTVTVTPGDDGTLTFTQHGRRWPQDDIIYIKEFSYNDDLTSGINTVQACLNDAALMNYQTRFASRFFEGGAMPITLWSVDGSITEDEQKRVQTFNNRTAGGIGKAWRNLFLRTKVEPHTLTQDLDKMTMPQLYSQATKNIANAFGIPVNMFMGDDNYASAAEHRLSFWQDVIRPRARILEDALNRQLLERMKLRIEFMFDEMDIFQADESMRADSLLKLVQAGVPTGDAMQILGYDLPEGREYAQYNVLPEPEVTEAPGSEPEALPLDEELGKWQKKSIKGLKRQSADFHLREHHPEEMQAEIHEALKYAMTRMSQERIRWTYVPAAWLMLLCSKRD